jgi:plasmid maintenance system antidote protein VapI
MACLYRHIRKDLNVPFYVGIGKNLNRAYSKSHRNNHWLSIVQKTEYDVHIILDEIDYEFAKEKEKEFIDLYKRKVDGGTLCNITKGGDGVLGIVHSEEARKKMGEPNKGKTISEWHRKRISEFHTGKIVSEETKEKMSKSLLGKSLGIKASEETKNKMSASARKGEDNHSSKLIASEILEIRRLSSEGMGQRKIATKFNVTKGTISNILKGLTWKHV